MAIKLSRTDAKKLKLSDAAMAGLPRRKWEAMPSAFAAACEAAGLPSPQTEFKFDPKRKWRFDYLFGGWLALEVEGGAWTNGRHNRGSGFSKDMEKYNAAAMLGYAVLRCLPSEIACGAAVELVCQAYTVETYRRAARMWA